MYQAVGRRAVLKANALFVMIKDRWLSTMVKASRLVPIANFELIVPFVRIMKILYTVFILEPKGFRIKLFSKLIKINK